MATFRQLASSYTDAVEAIAIDRDSGDLEAELDRRLRAIEVGPSVAVNEVADVFALRTERIDLSARSW